MGSTHGTTLARIYAGQARAITIRSATGFWVYPHGDRIVKSSQIAPAEKNEDIR